ncbi:MAG: DUF6531 domain-containing protein, partial [Actinobacteria bacterium]|nr:DUF6531 domain-containing protein [Actinomycetota bacterium]
DVGVRSIFAFSGIFFSDGQVTVVAQGQTVETPVAFDDSPGQVAHRVAANLVTAGVAGANAIGSAIRVPDPQATVTTDVGGLTIVQLPPMPEGGYAGGTIDCCGRGERKPLLEKLNFLENPLPPGHDPMSDPRPPPWPCQEPYRGDLQLGAGVFGHSGEFGYQKSFLHIPGRGMDYDFALTYRSRSPLQSGNLGFGWSHNWERRLAKTSDSKHIVVSNGFGRADVFTQDSTDPNNYVDGYGQFRMVWEENGRAYVRDRYGTTEVYEVTCGLLLEVIDRNGNKISIRYTENCHVKSVIDTLGRTIEYIHADVAVPNPKNGVIDYEERLIAVRDFTGRTVLLDYAGADGPDVNHGDLVAVTSPGVTQSALGVNDFPAGKTTRFTYDTRRCPIGAPFNCKTDELWHNLLTVTEPGETEPSIRNLYEDDELAFEFDRVVAQEVGSTALQGQNRWSYYLYQPLPGSTDVSGCYEIRVAEIDRKGFKREYDINGLGYVIREALFTGHFDPSGNFLDRDGLRPLGTGAGEVPEAYVTIYDRNVDGLIAQEFRPDGSIVQNTFYPPTPPNNAVERLKRGNVLSTTIIPAPVPGNAQPSITTSFTYEPVFNQIKTQTSPRGFTTTYTYDYEEALAGGSHPSVQLLDKNQNGIFEA